MFEIGLDDNVMPHVNILLLGPIGAGKSSFFNTIDSIFRGRMAMKARAGSLQNSLTKRVSGKSMKIIRKKSFNLHPVLYNFLSKRSVK